MNKQQRQADEDRRIQQVLSDWRWIKGLRSQAAGDDRIIRKVPR